MIVQTGLDNIRDKIYDLFVNGVIGTGSTAPLVTDTSLEYEISGSDLPLNVKTKGTNQVDIRYSVASSDFNGNSISEFGITDGSALQVRVTFPTVTKESDSTLDILYGVKIEQEEI